MFFSPSDCCIADGFLRIYLELLNLGHLSNVICLMVSCNLSQYGTNIVLCCLNSIVSVYFYVLVFETFLDCEFLLLTLYLEFGNFDDAKLFVDIIKDIINLVLIVL